MRISRQAPRVNLRQAHFYESVARVRSVRMSMRRIRASNVCAVPPGAHRRGGGGERCARFVVFNARLAAFPPASGRKDGSPDRASGGPGGLLRCIRIRPGAPHPPKKFRWPPAALPPLSRSRRPQGSCLVDRRAMPSALGGAWGGGNGTGKRRFLHRLRVRPVFSASRKRSHPEGALTPKQRHHDGLRAAEGPSPGRRGAGCAAAIRAHGSAGKVLRSAPKCFHAGRLRCGASLRMTGLALSLATPSQAQGPGISGPAGRPGAG
jgi:hypothetical protein